MWNPHGVRDTWKSPKEGVMHIDYRVHKSVVDSFLIAKYGQIFYFILFFLFIFFFGGGGHFFHQLVKSINFSP